MVYLISCYFTILTSLFSTDVVTGRRSNRILTTIPRCLHNRCEIPLTDTKTEDRLLRIAACEPDPSEVNIARLAMVTVSPINATCGMQKSIQFCGVRNPNACMYCDQERSGLVHSPDMMTDGLDWTWWQSSLLARGSTITPVDITLSLPKTFILTDDIIIKFYKALPSQLLVEKSSDRGRTWKIMQRFAQDCKTMWNMPPKSGSASLDEDFCTNINSSYSYKTIPDSRPNIKVSVLDRVQRNNFSNKEFCDRLINTKDELRDLLQITDLRIRLIRPSILLDSIQDSTKQRHYAIQGVEIKARCECNGHAQECLIDQQSKTAQCVCRHNTVGRECNKCRTMYWLYEWQPGRYSRTDSAGSASICQSYSSLSYMQNTSRHAASRRTEFRDFELHSMAAERRSNNSNLLQCNCNNHTERCQKHTDGGILCIDCFHHTQGRRCHRCQRSYYQDRSKRVNDPNMCLPCNCHPERSLSDWCDRDGRCVCIGKWDGKTCTKCKKGYNLIIQGNMQVCQEITTQPCSTNSTLPTKMQSCGLNNSLCANPNDNSASASSKIWNLHFILQSTLMSIIAISISVYR